MRRYGTCVTASAVGFMLACAFGASAATIQVPEDQPTIQAAIDAAANGDEVVLAAGTYSGAGNRDLDMQGKAVTVRSTNPENPGIVAATIIDCGGTSSEPHRAFLFHTGEGTGSVVAGIRIANGSGPYYDFGGNGNTTGGAILCLSGTSPTIRKCAFVNDSAGWGGAIHCYQSNSTIAECSFDGCPSEHGGAILATHCTPSVQGCAITNCTGSVAGGGIRFQHTTGGTISHCIIANGSSFHGGAVAVDSDPQFTIDNCLMYGNTGISGGAMYVGGSTAVIVNCTFTANEVSFAGGAISSVTSDLQITNSILWANEAPYFDQIIADAPGVSISYSNVLGGQAGIWVDVPSSLRWGPGNVEIDPLLTDGNGPCKYCLRASSPCIDAGDPSMGAPTGLKTAAGALTPLATETDVFGSSRVVNGRVDIGASEFVKPPRSLDLDADGDVDLRDFGVFQACFNGANRPPAKPNCDVADIDSDADVDLSDFASLQACFNGPNMPSACQ